MTEVNVEQPTEPTAVPESHERAPVAVTHPEGGRRDGIDLDAMAADLDGVDAALARLAEGTYWTDEVTGDTLPDALLNSDPIARRA